MVAHLRIRAPTHLRLCTFMHLQVRAFTHPAYALGPSPPNASTLPGIDDNLHRNLGKLHRMAGPNDLNLHAPPTTEDASSLRSARFVIIIAILITYAGLLSADFTSWDDYNTLARNPQFNPPGLHTLIHYATHEHMNLYVPVTYAVWTAVALLAHNPAPAGALGPADASTTLAAMPFHAANILLHILTSLIVLHVLQRLRFRVWPACFGTLAFALHPVQVESLGWISGLKDLLAWTLALASIALALRASSARPGSIVSVPADRRVWFGSALLFVLALLAKPSVVVAPLVFLVLLIAVRNTDPLISVLRSAWKPVVIGLFISALAVVGSRFVQPQSSFVDAPAIPLRPVVALDTLGFYLHKIVWPVDLTFDYSRPPRAVIESRAYFMTSIAPLLILLLVIVLARRGLRQPACLAAVALLGVLPVLGLISFDMQQYSTPADHYLYPSLLALGWLIAFFAARSKPALTIATSLLLILWAVMSSRQTDVWQNSITLYEHRLAIDDQSWPAHQGLAAHFVENAKTPDDLERALHHAERATEINPNFALGFISKSNALRRLGRTDEALRAGQQASQLEPDDPATLANLTALLADHARNLDATGHTEDAAQYRLEAIRIGQRAAKLFPDDPDAQLNLGLAFLDADRPEEAVAPLDRAIHLRPTHIPSLKARAAAEEARRQPTPATPPTP